MPDEQFGPLIAFSDVEFGLIGHLKTWTHTFLAARERKVGVTPGQVARPRSWITKQTFTVLPGEDNLPLITVVSNGTLEQPNRHGNGGYDVELRMAVTALCQGAETTIARRLAGHYQAALLDLLLKKKTFAVMTGVSAKLHSWLGMALDDVDPTVERTLASARLEFSVVVRDFANALGSGPGTVPIDPLVPQPDLPTVQDTDVSSQELP